MSGKNIQVAIKMRPLLKKETKSACYWKISGNSIQLVDSQSDPFCFDHIFDENVNNQVIFDTVAKPIVDSALRGFNGTIFAYGQTSSGKTYTMMGDHENPGVTIRAVRELFLEIENATDRKFLIRVGYMEIYNEKIYDLLDKKNQDLKVHENPSGEVTVNFTDVIIRSEIEMLEQLQKGNNARTIGETQMNERSSRSHAIFRIIIESQKTDNPADEAVQISHLDLVDLAGSERADQTGATGSRLKEGAHINRSLLSLGLVIKNLSENESVKFINYRDSKLTRILQASLGGNALTAIICTIKSTAIEETNSTLSFAMRAKCIKNKPHKNEILSEAAMMKRLEKEISRLRNELETEKTKNSKIKVIHLEEAIKRAELKIVHPHGNHTEKAQQRRRTWCPSTALPQPIAGSSQDCSENQNENEKCSLAVPGHMFMTPLITMRDYHTKDMPEEEFIPATEFEFSAIMEKDEKVFQTPKKNFNVNLYVKDSLTPITDVRTQCKLLEKELDELKDFRSFEVNFGLEETKLQLQQKEIELLNKTAELNEATKKLEELNKDRAELLEIRDNSYEHQIKLERAQQRCHELESRISELNGRVTNLESQQSAYHNQIEESQRQLKNIKITSKDSESLQYELEQLKEKSKNREEQLVTLVDDRDKKIEQLEQKLKDTHSQVELAEILVAEAGSSIEPIKEVHNQSMQTLDESVNNTDSVLAEFQLQLDEYKKNLKEKDDLLKNLKGKVEELDRQNVKLQEDNNKLSDEMMDYVYESEVLTKKCKEYEEQIKSTAMPTKCFTSVSTSIADNDFETNDASMVLNQTAENMEFPKSIINEILDKLPESILNGDHRPESEEHESTPKLSETMSEQLSIEKNCLLQKISNFESLNSELKEQISKHELAKKELMLRLEELSNNLSAADDKNLEYIDIIEKLALSKTDLENQLTNANERLADLEATKSAESESKKVSEETYAALRLEISTLNDQLSGLQSEKKLFEEERNVFNQLEKELSDDAQEARSKLAELEKQKSEWETIILQSEEYLVKLKEQVTQLQYQLLRTQEEKEASDEKLVRIEEETKFVFESKIDDHKQVILSLEKKNTELCETLKDFDKVKVELEQQQALIESTKRQLDEKDLQLKRTQSELDLDDYEMLKVERDSLKQLNDDLSQQTDHLEQQVMSLREEQNKLSDDMKCLTNEKDEHQKEVVALRDQLAKMVQLEQELQNSLAQYRISNQNLESENKDVKDLNNNLEIKVNELNETNTVLVQQKSNALDENVSLKEKVNNLHNTMESLEKFNADLKEIEAKHLIEIETLRELNVNFEKQLATLKSDRANIEQQSFETKNECNILTLSLEDARQQVQELEKEYKDLKQSMNKTADNLLELQQERDALLDMKQQLESEFQRKLMEECELTVGELTNVRSQNLVLNDKVDTLTLEKEQLQASLYQSAERASNLNDEMKELRRKLEWFEELERSLAESKLENEKLMDCVTKYEAENNRYKKELELIAGTHKEQFEKARVKLTQMKSELDTQIQQFNRTRKENEDLKQEIHTKETEKKNLLDKLELMNTENNTAVKDKEELVRQLHEMQKMHVFKIKQYEQEIQTLKTKIEDISRKNVTSSRSPRHGSGDSENQMIKTLLGENNELKLKNQSLTAELHESRKILQQNRKTKRYSNHDESRALAWCDHRDVGTMTTPTDKLCNCEKLDKELTEARKSLLIKDCQINTLRMESKMNPLNNELETLKRAMEEEETEKREMNKELKKLRQKMSELYKEAKSSRNCDLCIRRSRIVVVNQFSQTDEQPKTRLEDDDHTLLQSKYEDLKRICRMRNTRINQLETLLSKKENDAGNMMHRNINMDSNTSDSVIRELTIVRTKYEEAKRIIGFRDCKIKSLEAELSNFKSNGSTATSFN